MKNMYMYIKAFIGSTDWENIWKRPQNKKYKLSP